MGAVKGHPPRSVTDDDGVCDYTGGGHNLRHRGIEDVELATLGWINWFNTDRIHSYLNDDSPDQYEAAYAAQQAGHNLVGIQ